MKLSFSYVAIDTDGRYPVLVTPSGVRLAMPSLDELERFLKEVQRVEEELHRLLGDRT